MQEYETNMQENDADMQKNGRDPGELIVLSQVQETETVWLWEPYIALGKVTIMQGDPGEGKSTIALHLAAAVTRGVSMENRNILVSNPDYVVYQNAEDGLADTIKPRLLRANADCENVFCLNDSKYPLEVGDGRIKMILEKLHPKLLILDPLQAYLGADVDMHRANEIRPIMTELSELAEQYHCAILLIGHMNKMQKGKSIYRGLGSIDLTAAARSVLLVVHAVHHLGQGGTHLSVRDDNCFIVIRIFFRFYQGPGVP